MNDKQVRAELERIGDGALSLLFVKYRRYQIDHHLLGEDDDNLVVVLRLLAQKHKALREIAANLNMAGAAVIRKPPKPPARRDNG